MKLFNVIVTGQQQHLKSATFENQTEEQVNKIIEKYHDSNEPEKYPVVMDGDSYEINNDYYITIVEIKIN